MEFLNSLEMGSMNLTKVGKILSKSFLDTVKTLGLNESWNKIIINKISEENEKVVPLLK